MSNARILLVDDDRFYREVATALLVERGHAVTTAEDGEDALVKYEPGAFDLVLTDLVMPNLDGHGLVTAIKQRDPDQEIVIVTQKADVREAVTALRGGASDYLLKPIDETEIAMCVARSLERASLKRERTRLLDENLEFVKNQILFRRCLELLATVDLERLQEQALADLCSVCNAQSGALWLADERHDLHLRAWRGLVDRARLPPRISPTDDFYRAGLAGPGAFALLGLPVSKGFLLPLRAAGQLVGLVLCADKLAGSFHEQDQQVARTVGEFAATALRNATRFSALERVGLRDRDTLAYSLSYFIDYAAKEIYKAQRYSRVFSLLTLSLDGLDALGAERGGEAAAGLARNVAACVGRVIRDSDIVAKAAPGEFYLLLPETDYLGALMLARRVRTGLAQEQVLAHAHAEGTVSVTLGAAAFPRDGQDFDELVHASRRRLEEGRRSLSRALNLSQLDFWQAALLLLGKPDSPRLPLDDRGGPTRRGPLPPGLFAQLQVEAAMEIARDPRARGLLYVGCGEIRSDLPVVAALEQVPPDSGLRVYLLGRRGDSTAHAGATPVFLEGDERIAGHEFLFLFSENASYALVQERSAGPSPWGVHTSDAAVVDDLVSKLQETYDLQPL